MTDPNAAGRYAYFDTFTVETQQRLIALDFVIRLAQNPTFAANFDAILNAATAVEDHLFPEPSDDQDEEEE